MKITDQKKLRLLAKIAEKSDTERYNVDYLHFTKNGDIHATNGRLAGIIFDGWEHEENDPEEIWIKLNSKQCNTKLKSITFLEGKAILNNGFITDTLSTEKVSWPPFKNFIPDYSNERLVQCAGMGSETTWIQSESGFNFGCWYSKESFIEKRCPTILDCLDDDCSNLIIIGHPTTPYDKDGNIIDMQKKFSRFFDTPIEKPVKEDFQLPENIQPDEKAVFEILENEPKHIDTICKVLEWPVARVSSALGLLEWKNLCVRESGMRFRIS